MLRAIPAGPLLVLAAVVAGCSVETLVPSDRPSGTLVRTSPPTPSAAALSPSIGPTVAWEETGEVVKVDTAVRRAFTESGGVRVSIEIERNPAPAGELTWLTATVQNLGPDTLHWYTDGCAIHVGVWGEYPLAWTWGEPQVFERFTFKDWALQTAGASRGDTIYLDFTPESLIGKDVGCADIGILQDLAPGAQVSQRTRWDGFAAFEYGPAPAGPVEAIGWFRSWWRGDEEFGERENIEVRLPIEVSGGRDPRFLSPGQAIDVALRTSALRIHLERYPKIQDWVGPIRLAVNEDGHWEVGLTGGDGSSVTVVVDPIGASVVEVVEVP